MKKRVLPIVLTVICVLVCLLLLTARTEEPITLGPYSMPRDVTLIALVINLEDETIYIEYEQGEEQPVSLEQTDFTQSILEELCEFPKLENLRISGYDGPWTFLDNCKALRYLYLGGCEISTLESVQLTQLNLQDCTGVNWSQIERFPALTELTLQEQFPEALSDLFPLTNLRILYLVVPYDVDYRGERFYIMNPAWSEIPNHAHFPFAQEEVNAYFAERDGAIWMYERR